MIESISIVLWDARHVQHALELLEGELHQLRLTQRRKGRRPVEEGADCQLDWLLLVRRRLRRRRNGSGLRNARHVAVKGRARGEGPGRAARPHHQKARQPHQAPQRARRLAPPPPRPAAPRLHAEPAAAESVCRAGYGRSHRVRGPRQHWRLAVHRRGDRGEAGGGRGGEGGGEGKGGKGQGRAQRRRRAALQDLAPIPARSGRRALRRGRRVTLSRARRGFTLKSRKDGARGARGRLCPALQVG
mmetsp:Transcript_9555/g.22956  ORF Transcript_9555/g.22956 Transcript_9555/m.22956 type:complete len:245 (+) Transcript_9555:2470-3204(+)